MKNKTRGLIILAVIFVVFSVIAFVIPTPKNATFWIGFVAGVIAIAFQIYIFKISFGKGDDVKSRFYGFPIARVGVIYLVIQLILSIAEVSLSMFIPYWIVLIVDVLPLAFAIIGSVTADMMRDEIARQDVELKKNVENIRELQSLSASISTQCEIDGLKDELSSLAEEFRFSDPVSSDKTEELELTLKNQLNDLQNAVIDGDEDSARTLIKKVFANLKERNRICALSK